MRNIRITLILLFVFTFFLGTCSGGDDLDFYICPRRCPSSAPWTIDYIETPYPCYNTKEECIAAAIKAGFTADRCVKCDY